ncbi:unnamed protein product [Mycena citricolor]|uniref:AB hydrolase-1 domain-containing protein n=1 Tax=Mycena citricolor TaxID=2018698 RepID=A0AAD2Q109_9AGAR|nr:unnamed protein product [Mycena citricolor]
MPQLSEESTALPPSGGYPLYLTAKRYWVPSCEAHAADPRALTLLLLHATSFHKETWMPTLEALFAAADRPGSPVKIREAICLDCPNHGESGQMNAVVLLQPEFFLNFSCERYAQAVHHFLSLKPFGIDFQSRNLVGIGHSLGGCTLTMLQAITPVFPFSSIILIEPLISPHGSHHLRKLREILVKGAYERRDVWPDRQQAMAALKRRDRTKKWDPRILENFVQYGILEHPGAKYAEGRYPGVTLACQRDQEAAMYRDPDGATKPMPTLKRICRDPKRVHAAIREDVAWASIEVLEGAGHLIVQEVPDRLGEAIHATLASNGDLVRSKL